MPSKVLFVIKKTQRPFGPLRTKVVIVGNSKSVKNHHFCAKYLTVLVKTVSPHIYSTLVNNNIVIYCGSGVNVLKNF